MDDNYRNKISLCPKYIEWTRLSDNSEMFYCKTFYRKPVDEIKLLAHIKRTIVAKDRATQKRKKQKMESPPNDELLEKVRNNDVYKEFMKLEPGKTKFYDRRDYVRGNSADLIKLMNRISNRMNCNKRRTSALGDSVDIEIEKRGAVVAYSVGVDVEIGKRDAAVALLSLDNPRGGDATSPLNNIVIKEGGAEAEEADGRRDDINFEGDRDAVGTLLSLDNPKGGNATSPLNNVVIKEGGWFGGRGGVKGEGRKRH